MGHYSKNLSPLADEVVTECEFVSLDQKRRVMAFHTTNRIYPPGHRLRMCPADSFVRLVSPFKYNRAEPWPYKYNRAEPCRTVAIQI